MLKLAIIASILAPGMAFVNSGAFVGRENSALSMKAQNRDQPSTTMSVFDKVLRPLAPFALSAALLTTQVGVQLPFVGNTVASAATNKATPANLPKAAEDPVAMMQSQRSVKGKGSAKIDLKYEPIRADTQQVSKAVATAKPKPAKPLSVNDLKDKPEPAKKAAPSRPVPVSRPSPAPKASTAKKTAPAPAPVAAKKKLTTAQKKQAEKSAIPTKPAAPAAKSVPTKKTSPAPATPAKPSAKMTSAQKKQAEKKTAATPAKATAPAAKRLTTAQQKALARGS